MDNLLVYIEMARREGYVLNFESVSVDTGDFMRIDLSKGLINISRVLTRQELLEFKGDLIYDALFNMFRELKDREVNNG